MCRVSDKLEVYTSIKKTGIELVSENFFESCEKYTAFIQFISFGLVVGHLYASDSLALFTQENFYLKEKSFSGSQHDEITVSAPNAILALFPRFHLNFKTYDITS